MPANSDIPSVALDPNSPSFATPDAAADAVSKGFGKIPKYEQAAILIQKPDGSYAYSTVAHQKDHDNFALQAAIPHGHKLAGIVHSHPGDDDNGQVFSPHDLDVADQLKVPSFVRFLKDDSVRSYTPGKTKTSFIKQAGTKLQSRVADGDPIAQIQPAPAPVPSQPAAAPADQGLLAQAVQSSPQ